MSALYTALLEGETKESLTNMVCVLRTERVVLRRMIENLLEIINSGKTTVNMLEEALKMIEDEQSKQT